MAETFNVRLKDGSGNILHPETDWSVVQNKPSINIGDSNGQRRETWNAPITSVVGTNALYLASPQGNIMVNDHTVGKNMPLADYPINNAKQAETLSLPEALKTGSFGYLDLGIPTEHASFETIYLVTCDSGEASGTTYKFYFFRDGSWIETDALQYKPGTTSYTISGNVYNLRPFVK